MAFRHVRQNFTRYAQRSMDNFMRRKPGHTEWCMPFNRSVGLVMLNFTAGGLIAGPAFASMALVSDYRYHRFLSLKEVFIGWTAARSFLSYHLSGILIISAMVLLIYRVACCGELGGAFPGLRPIHGAALGGPPCSGRTQCQPSQ